MIKILNIFIKSAKWIAHALILQLFLLSLSFPVLVAWGIAFSPLIFLGNIIFTPVLTLFLALSCVIYILELCFIPSGYICTALDFITCGWMAAMSWAPDIPMIGCPQTPLWVLVIMPLGSWAILRAFGLKKCFVILGILAVWVFMVFCGIKWWFTPVYKECDLVCGSRYVTLRLKEKQVVFIDSQSALQSRACSQAWIDYTLSSELVKNFGVTTIDVIIVAKSTPATLLRLKALCKKYHCKKVFDAQGFRLQI